jgi:hypothetical protein
MIEDFFKAHQHTIAAIGAVSTFAAVVTSLWLARRATRADRTRLKARADLVLIFHAPIDGKSVPKFLKVRITNIGRFPLHIPSVFFYWKVPFKREFMEVPPLDLTGSPLIPPQHYPSVISPRASVGFTIWDVDTFKREVKRMRGADTLADRLRFRFIRAFVHTDDGETFKVKLSPEVRAVWLERDST